jgi:hypothetical protein
MSTLDEIAEEKQRIGEALARADAQREKLTGQLSELEATERVLARYSKGTQTKKVAAAKTPTATTKAAPVRSRERRRPATEKSAGGKRSSSSLGDQVLALATARRSRKSPQHARELARTMSAPPFRGTSGLAASSSATGSSMPRSRRGRSNAPRSDPGTRRLAAAAGSLAEADGHALDRFGIDRVLGGNRHPNLCTSHRLTQRWTGQLGANQRSGCER